MKKLKLWIVPAIILLAVTSMGAYRLIGAATGISLDLGGTTLFASRQITVDTGGGLDINMGTAADDDFTIDSTGFVYEGDTGNVGIGTTSPGAKLDIIGGSLNLDGELQFNSTGYNIQWDNSGALHLESANHMRFYIDADNNAVGKFEIYGNSVEGASSGALVTVFDTGNVGIGTTDPQGLIQKSSADAHGGYIEEVYAATSGTLAGATDKIELNIPTGWRILQCQLHVKTAVSDDDGDDTWSSELNDGAQEEVISAGSAKAQNTNVSHWADEETWGTLTDAETDILLTPNGTNFDGGEIEAHCLCLGFDAWDNE